MCLFIKWGCNDSVPPWQEKGNFFFGEQKEFQSKTGELQLAMGILQKKNHAED